MGPRVQFARLSDIPAWMHGTLRISTAALSWARGWCTSPAALSPWRSWVMHLSRLTLRISTAALSWALAEARYERDAWVSLPAGSAAAPASW